MRLTDSSLATVCANSPSFLLSNKHAVRTSQETHYVSATKLNRLMLFGETAAVYCENHTEHTDALCEQNECFSALKQAVHTVTTGF
jgi:hypothetical protein